MEYTRYESKTKLNSNWIGNWNIDLVVLTEMKRKGQGSENLRSYDNFYSVALKEKKAKT